jgi:SGNH domain (fused to AT3 domains)
MLIAYGQEYSQAKGKPFVFRQFGRGACPMLAGMGSEHCKEITQHAERYIEENNSIHTVILAANWPLYFYGQDQQNDGTLDTATFKEAFTKTVMYYRSKGKRVIVFLSPPTGANPRACVVRPMRLTNENNCSLSLHDALNNSRSYRAPFISQLEALCVDFFDPFKSMCSEKTCTVSDGARIYYLDHEHFSAFGGQFLAEAANSDLRQLLNPASQ